MKKNLLFLGVFLAIALTGCNDVKPDSEATEILPTETEETETQEVLKVRYITDLYKGERTPKSRSIKDAPNAELIYEDENYAYYFEYTRAEEIRVRYEDGSKENLKEALAARRITISDVTDKGWGVFICDRSLGEGQDAQFYNIVVEEGVSTNAVHEVFYEDEEYKYYFTSAQSIVTLVYYTDGTREPIDEALAAGRITIADVDACGIIYGKEAK